MKKVCMKLLASVLAVSVINPLASALAANTVKITEIAVLEEKNGETERTTYAPDAQDISLTPEQMLEVTVKVEDEESNPVNAINATFFSYLSTENGGEATLGDSTIQYAAQNLTGEDGTVTVSFRPRMSIGTDGTGSFIAQLGAANASEAASFNYKVGKIIKQMELTARKNSIEADSDENAVFVIKAAGFSGTDYSGFKVYLDDTQLASDKYAITADNSDILLTISSENFADKEAGTKINVKVMLDGYNEVSGVIDITAPEIYRITYHTDGGTINGEYASDYRFGEGAVLPSDVIKENYTFGGWYETRELSGESVTSISAEASGDKTYYAKWIPNTYTVTLNANGGTIADGKNITSYTYGNAVKLPTKDDIAFAGKFFAGWYKDENCTGDPVTAILATDTGNIILYAKWQEEEPTMYKITFVNYDGSELESVDVLEGKTPQYSGTTPQRPADEKNRYIFSNWTPAIESASKDMTYTAEYQTITRKYIKVYDNFKADISEIEEVDGKWIITVQNEEVLSNLTMYKVTYTSGGVLESVQQIAVSSETDVPELAENDKIMLWSKNMAPVTEVVGN